MRFFCLLLLLSLSLSACSQTEQPTTIKAEVSAITRAETSSTLAVGGVRLFLTPDPLTSADRAKVEAIGCGSEVEYSWLINDQPVPGANDDNLKQTFYAKEDKLSVQVLCAGKLEVLTARVANTPPVISRVMFDNPAVISGRAITVLPEAEDIDGDTVEFRFHWTIDGELISEIEGPTLPGIYVQRGRAIGVNVLPSDEDTEGVTFAGQAFIVPNSPPRFVSRPPAAFQTNDYRYQVRGDDPDGDSLSFRLDEGPTGMSIDSVTGLLSWPIGSGGSGEKRISIMVADPEGLQARQEYTINLSVLESTE